MINIVALGTAFLLGVGAGLIVEGNDWTSFLTSYIPALATLVAAYYGAKYAFQFQTDKELSAERKHNIMSANTAIFTLSRMADNLFNYQTKIINPVRNNGAVFIELRPTLEFEKENIKFNIDSLYFILQTEDRNLLSEIILEQERYRVTVDAINRRSKMHLEEIQPLLEKAGFISNRANYVSDLDVEKILGNRLYSMMIESTNDVIHNVDSTLESIGILANKVKDVMKKIYPEDAIISFVLPKTSE